MTGRPKLSAERGVIPRPARANGRRLQTARDLFPGQRRSGRPRPWLCCRRRRWELELSGIDTLYDWYRRYGGADVVPGIRPQPRSGVVILTCMDARVMPTSMFGVRFGDVHILRNAGGLVTTDVIRSLLVSQLVLSTREVMVIMHTKCGLLGADDRELRERARRVTGSLPGVDFMAFARIEDRLEESVSELRRTRTVDADVRGFIFDVDTGVLTEHQVR